MLNKTHHYKAKTKWANAAGEDTSNFDGYSRNFQTDFPGKPTLLGSSDASFRGDKDRVNPEDMLVAAISSCHMLWYLALCSKAGVRVLAYEDSAEGSMEMHADGGGAFSSVTLQPVVTIAPGCDVELAKALHEGAHDKCFIARSCSVPIQIFPTIKN